MENENKKEVLIVHHNDLDGYVSALYAKKYFEVLQEQNQMDIEKIDMRIASYAGRDRLFTYISEKCDTYKENLLLVILDFSFRPEDLEELAEKIGYKNIIWIDHHASVINDYRNWDNHALIRGLRITTGLSAAELTYLFFDEGFPISDCNTFTQPSFANNTIDFHGEDLVESYDLTDTKQRDHLLDEFIPDGLRIAGDWDTWRHMEHPEVRDAIYMNHWFTVHRKDFFQNEDDDKALFTLFFEDENTTHYDETDGTTQLDCILLEGNIIDGYILETDKSSMRNAFEAIIRGFEDINVIAVNSNRFTSMVFDSVKDKYEVGVVYIFNGKYNNMTYSFYRLNQNPEKNISCFKIAESFGGGGHASAAGCSVDKELEVLRVKTIG